jgi:hypothetical protein
VLLGCFFAGGENVLESATGEILELDEKPSALRGQKLCDRNRPGASDGAPDGVFSVARFLDGVGRRRDLSRRKELLEATDSVIPRSAATRNLRDRALLRGADLSLRSG